MVLDSTQAVRFVRQFLTPVPPALFVIEDEPLHNNDWAGHTNPDQALEWEIMLIYFLLTYNQVYMTILMKQTHASTE